MQTKFGRTIVLVAALVAALLALTLLGGTARAQTSPPEPENELLAQLGLATVQMGSAHFGLDWNLVTPGGGNVGSPHFHISASLGQPTVGAKSSPHYETCTGFWCGLDFIKRIFMPLLLRDS